MNNKQILELISNGESSVVEFKVGKGSNYSNIYRTMCAFANSKGGNILIGVTDNGEIVGCDPHFLNIIKLRVKDYIDNLGDSSITPIIEDTFIDGKLIICITVPKGDKIQTYNGTVYYRIGEAVVNGSAAKAYHSINRSGVYNFLMHEDSTLLDSFQIALRVLEPFKEWVENHKGWNMILGFPTDEREKSVQSLIDLAGRDYCKNNNIDMSFEANEGPGPVDLKLSRGNDKTVIEVKLSSNNQYIHGYEVQIEEYAKAEGTNKRIYVYIDIGNPVRTKRIKEVAKTKKAAGKNPPVLYIIDSQPRESASIKNNRSFRIV